MITALIVLVLVIGAGVAGFAFRGKESKLLKQVGQDVKEKVNSKL